MDISSEEDERTLTMIVSFIMYISGAKSKDHCSNISRDMLG